MGNDKQADEWFKQAEYDLGTAEAMFRGRRYIYTVFMCHLSLEKALKGVLSRQGLATLKSHDLVYLMEKIGIDVPEEHAEFMEMLSEVSVPTRYPEELDRLVAHYPRKRTAEIVAQCREVNEWLKNCS